MTTTTKAPPIRLPRSFNKVWEDSLIVALRDLQWQHGAKPLGVPELMVKMDGNVETATADVLYAMQGRFFLFELKSSASDSTSESIKPIIKIFGAIDRLRSADKQNPTNSPSEKARELFYKMSNLGHHLVMADVTNEPYQVGSIPHQEISLMSAHYYKVATKLYANRKYKAVPDYDLSVTTYKGLKNLGGGISLLGLTAEAMAAYIHFLVKAHKAATSKVNHPLKAVVWSTTGFAWPCVKMDDLLQLSEWLGVASQAGPNSFWPNLHPTMSDLVALLGSRHSRSFWLLFSHKSVNSRTTFQAPVRPQAHQQQTNNPDSSFTP
ncbi:hypothetical protein [Herbaspirillum sp. alder98]|uniref:hypothetical protein n=1 Tax=Herbaspirillum sp. alder98 TaxID=2913096 RepID=UPI001CD89EC4|nr:hypothetical protein [Herbaspirillum sp. alder98]MCA1326393.1 hypothetical protein [Herbaspirillum sp. alder98]